MNHRVRTAGTVALVAVVGLTLAALSINGSGVYGLSLFLAVPFFTGFAVTALLSIGPPRRFLVCLGWSAAAGVLLSLLFLVTGSEGLICIAMSVPLAVPLIALGSAMAWALFHAERLEHAKTSVGLLACLIAAAMSVEGRMRESSSSRIWVVSDSVIVEEAPEEVWNTIVTLSDVEPPRGDVFFAAGIACPQRTRIVHAADGGLRVCTMTTGTLLERIDRWEPGRRLAWRALSTPPPMKELNPFREADPPHLHGFYRNVRGEYALERAGAGRTRLTRRTWYQHDLYPAQYWRLWCDFGASKIHRLVLEHVRMESERRSGGTRI